MVGLMAHAAEVEANCAICGAPPVPECPHEAERLKLAMDQAIERWAGMQLIREWVLSHATNQIITTFHHLRALRMQAHVAYLETLPFYTLYHRYNGAPPLAPAQLQLVHAQMADANRMLQHGVDQDWRTACQRYPEVLDYYFNLIGVPSFPAESDPLIQDPRFGPGPAAKAIEGPRGAGAMMMGGGGRDGRDGGGGGGGGERGGGMGRKASNAQHHQAMRRDSMEMVTVKEHRKKERRRSRGRGPTPPPHVPMVGSYRR